MKAEIAPELSNTVQTTLRRGEYFEFIMKARQAETAEGQQLLPPAKGLWRSFRRPRFPAISIRISLCPLW